MGAGGSVPKTDETARYKERLDRYLDRWRRLAIASAEFQEACCIHEKGRFISLRLYQHALFNWLYQDMEEAALADDTLVSSVYEMCHAFSPTTHDAQLRLSAGRVKVILGYPEIREFPTKGDGRDWVLIGLSICEFPTRDTLLKHGNPGSRCHPWDVPPASGAPDPRPKSPVL